MPTGVYLRTDAYRQKQREAMRRRENPGKNKSEETRRLIGDSQRGKPKSEEFKEKCRLRMIGKPSFFKGHKHSHEVVLQMRKRLLGGNHWNWKGGVCPKERRNAYNVSLRRKKNGFSEELFATRLAEQRGKCAVCSVSLGVGLSATAASADHCHDSGLPRGILCKRCNLMLGHAKDDPSLLLQAVDYLNRWKRTA